MFNKRYIKDAAAKFIMKGHRNMDEKIIGTDEIYLATEPESISATEEFVETEGLQPKSLENSRVSENELLRTENSKVFNLADGRMQEVIYSQPVHLVENDVLVDIDNTIVEDDEKHFRNARGAFTAKFNREDDSNELFSVESGDCKLTVSAKKNSRQKTGVKAKLRDRNTKKERMIFTGAATDTELEYFVTGEQVKENIVIKKPKTAYNFAFEIAMENLHIDFLEEENRISFSSKTTSDEMFHIPAPFMMDAAGNLSTDVSYKISEVSENSAVLEVVPNNEWINAEGRQFPVTIDPQIKVSNEEKITTYSALYGYVTKPSSHQLTTVYGDANCCNAEYMFIALNYPINGINYRVTKAELKLKQLYGSCYSSSYKPHLKLYTCGSEFMYNQEINLSESNLIDYNVMQIGETEYVFDVTSVVDHLVSEYAYTTYLALKLEDVSANKYGDITIAGATASTGSPELSLTYDAFEGMTTDNTVATHDLKRLGTGSVDLVHGNLLIDSTDFAWSGNKMPVTIKHYYNSELSDMHFTKNLAQYIYSADYNNMKVGKGWFLSYMQSIIPATFEHNGEMCYGYIYTDENGKFVKFIESDSEEHTRSDYPGCNYQLYTDVDGNGYTYNIYHYQMEKDGRVYNFNYNGYLESIEENGMRQTINYIKTGQISSITDGAGREFIFSYNSDSYLSAIVAPDGSAVKYEYSDGYLTKIVYPESTAKITYGWNCTISSPEYIEITDNDYSEYSSTNKYIVNYWYTTYRVISISETTGNYYSSTYGDRTYINYNISGRNTTLTTYLQADGEDAATNMQTVYSFDDNGELLSTYMYSKDEGNMEVTVGSGINPYSEGDSSEVSNVNNLLMNHRFEELDNKLIGWDTIATGSCSFTPSVIESDGLYGTKAVLFDPISYYDGEYGITQTTNALPIGDYAFSAYVKTSQENTADDVGVYLQVEDTDGNILYQSERLDDTFGDYVRLVAPFKLESQKTVKVSIISSGGNKVYVNAPQLEDNAFANQYNMLENGNFENGITGWTTSGGYEITTKQKFNMTRSLLLNGSITGNRFAYQTIPLKSAKSIRENLVLSGWAKGIALPDRKREGAQSSTFRLRAVLTYADCQTEEFIADFSPNTEGWQKASVEIAKTQYKEVSNLVIYCEYGYNSAYAYFDDIQLISGETETNLSYSDFPVYNSEDSSSAADYDSAVENDNEFKELTDSIGNALTGTQFTDGEYGAIYTANAYTEEGKSVKSALFGNDLISEIDSRGNVTKYDVDERTSRNKSITDRLGNTVDYEYDANGNVISIAHKRFDNTSFADVSYTYHPNNGLNSITRGDGMKYNLTYDSFANLASIGINGKTKKLVSYTYRKGSHSIKRIDYANGDYSELKYNSLGHVITENWFTSSGEALAKYRYGYDQSGNLAKSLDILNSIEYNYYYKDERIQRATESTVELQRINGCKTENVISKTLKHSVLYHYDTEGNLIKKRYVDEQGTKTYFIEHREDGSQVYTLPTNVVSHSKTDHLGRLEFDELQLGKGFISRRFSYHDGEATYKHIENNMLKSSPTTSLVRQILLSDGSTLSYEYDAEERITSVVDKHSVNGEVIETKYEYTYDSLGQLLTETVNGVAVNTMTYDNYGNILTKNGKTYTYGDSKWKDLLTEYDGQTITYDDGGNPINYLGHTLAWEKGRQLKSFDDIIYTYNANGIRTSKTVNGVKHEYTLDGTNIVKETWDGNTLVPLYDNTESVCGITYSGTSYYFLKNLQGDVIAITDATGTVVARYTYDAWGVCTIESDTTDCNIAEINPYRYRGYYLDREIGMYYLQSRYYDPQVGRFVNPDMAEIAIIQCAIVEHNLFTYCGNAPISNIDPFGLYYVKLKTLAKVVLMVVGFNPIGATLISIGLYKAKVLITAKMALLGAKIGKFWGPIVCGILTGLFALLGLSIGGQIAAALWECANEGKKGIEFTIKKNRWGIPYKLDIHAK